MEWQKRQATTINKPSKNSTVSTSLGLFILLDQRRLENHSQSLNRHHSFLLHSSRLLLQLLLCPFLLARRDRLRIIIFTQW
jgi:hypothetical protein